MEGGFPSRARFAVTFVKDQARLWDSRLGQGLVLHVACCVSVSNHCPHRTVSCSLSLREDVGESVRREAACFILQLWGVCHP